MPHQNELAGARYVWLGRLTLHTRLLWNLPARVLRNRRTHRALFISDLYVVANELTHRPALFAAERQNNPFAFFRLACGIKANYE
jgi:hypothetical protein